MADTIGGVIKWIVIIVVVLFLFNQFAGKKQYAGGAWATSTFTCTSNHCFCYEYTQQASSCYNNALQSNIGMKYVIETDCQLQSPLLDCMLEYGINKGVGPTTVQCSDPGICGNIGCTSTCLQNGAVACVSSTQSKKCYDQNNDGCLEWVYQNCTSNQYCPTESGVCITGGTCNSPADTNCNNCVENPEFTTYKSRWLSFDIAVGNTAYTDAKSKWIIFDGC